MCASPQRKTNPRPARSNSSLLPSPRSTHTQGNHTDATATSFSIQNNAILDGFTDPRGNKGIYLADYAQHRAYMVIGTTCHEQPERGSIQDRIPDLRRVTYNKTDTYKGQQVYVWNDSNGGRGPRGIEYLTTADTNEYVDPSPLCDKCRSSQPTHREPFTIRPPLAAGTPSPSRTSTTASATTTVSNPPPTTRRKRTPVTSLLGTLLTHTPLTHPTPLRSQLRGRHQLAVGHLRQAGGLPVRRPASEGASGGGDGHGAASSARAPANTNDRDDAKCRW